MSLLFSLLNPEPVAADFTLDTVRKNLAQRLAVAAKAQTVDLQFLGEGDRKLGQLGHGDALDHSRWMEEVVDGHQICVPIIAASRVAGRIEVREPIDKKGFGSQERMLVKSVVAYLGMIASRAALLHTQEDFTERMSEDLRIQTMYDAVCEATEQANGNLEKAAEATVRLVGRGIACRCAIIIFWKGRKQLVCCENGDRDSVEKLKQVVHDQRGAIFQKGCYVRSFLRASEAQEERKSFEPLTAIVASPLNRFSSGKGIIALARDGKGAEFTTMEKRALRVLSAFLSEWNTKK
jgi:hypothetical protein